MRCWEHGAENRRWSINLETLDTNRKVLGKEILQRTKLLLARWERETEPA